jgi:hypothetical protein
MQIEKFKMENVRKRKQGGGISGYRKKAAADGFLTKPSNFTLKISGY